MAETTGEKVGDRGSCGRQEILDAATALFAEHGFNDADTQRLVCRLGVGKGTLYRHFASKRELFLAAVDRGMLRLREFQEAALDGVDDPLERIAVGVRTYLEFFEQHPEVVELLMQERALFRDRKRPTYFEHRERNVRQWRDLYRSMMEQGRLRRMSAERISDVVGQLLYGTVFVNYFNGQTKSTAEQADEILDVVLRGILSEAERARTDAPADAPPPE